MNYQAGYLKMFTMLTQLTEQLEKMQPAQETVNVALLLRRIQAEGEEACIRDSES